MTATILVTGGTGTLGRQVVAGLRAEGTPVRVLSRRPHAASPVDLAVPAASSDIEYVVGDLTSGAGVAAAVRGADVIVHCAGSARGDDVKARNLVKATPPGTHIVYISVVGADRIPVVSAWDRAMFSYYASKRAGEEVIATSGLQWTTLRATQFHELVRTVAKGLSRLPIMPTFADIRFQPVDSGDVAARLVELARGEPSGLVAELGGPRVYPMADLMRGYLEAAGKRRLILPVALPGQAARALRAGANLTPAHAVGRRTWEEFLAGSVRVDSSPIRPATPR